MALVMGLVCNTIITPASYVYKHSNTVLNSRLVPWYGRIKPWNDRIMPWNDHIVAWNETIIS